MPAFASKKQHRMLMAILHGKKGKTSRGDSGPPKSVAEKYSGSSKDLPDSKGKEHKGGHWNKIKKSDEKKGVGVIVVNKEGQILIGKSTKNKDSYLLPGGSVDEGETPKEAAIRELKEEVGIEAKALEEASSDEFGLNFIVREWTGEIKSSSEIQDPKFVSINEIPWSHMRNCCVPGLVSFISKQLSKSKKLSDMVLIEKLQKNILRTSQVSGAVYEITHGDALKLVGNGVFRILSKGVKGMGDDEVREVKMGQYVLMIRKHANDVYSGHIRDGHKTIHHFVNRSLPTATADLMSVFEWYMPEDIPEPEIEDEDKLSDDVIESGLNHMISNYRHYNLADIYDEMESIREEVRQGMAVDLQQVEERMGKLIDKLDERLDNISEKHNNLSRALGSDIDEIESKLRQLKNNLPEEKSSSVTAVLSNKPNLKSVLDSFYEYLSKPSVMIEPSGRVHINFGPDWSKLDQSNFLSDLKAKIPKTK